MGKSMKEEKVLIAKLNSESKWFDEEVYAEAEKDAIKFLKEGCRMSGQAYQMHGSIDSKNVAHNDVVSYFYGGDEGLRESVIKIVKNSKSGIMNFLVSRSEDLEIIRKFKKPIGKCYVGDESIETCTCKVVISKDWYTGELYTKTAYPILA